MYYSNEIIDEVRSANDIVDVVSSYKGWVFNRSVRLGRALG